MSATTTPATTTQTPATTTAAPDPNATTTTATHTPDAKTAPEASALQAQIAELQAKLKARDDAEAKAKTDAEAKAEADRVAKLTADQKVQEELAKQRGELDATKAQLVTERRNLALDKLGVASKFREFAPKVDPQDAAGAKALEDWAKLNPELRAQTTTTQTTGNSALDLLKQKAQGALADVLSGKKKSSLVTERNINKMVS